MTQKKTASENFQIRTQVLIRGGDINPATTATDKVVEINSSLSQAQEWTDYWKNLAKQYKLVKIELIYSSFVEGNSDKGQIVLGQIEEDAAAPTSWNNYIESHWFNPNVKHFHAGRRTVRVPIDLTADQKGWQDKGDDSETMFRWWYGLYNHEYTASYDVGSVEIEITLDIKK